MIIHYISEETRKKYGSKLEGTTGKKKIKSPCPDCEIKELKRKQKKSVIRDDSGDIIKETK